MTETLLPYLLPLFLLLPPVSGIEFIPSPTNLKNPDGITFDPLGLLSTLPNPRADRSASRLYARTPRDRSLFHWPHTGAMLGGVLIPLKTLVEHVASAGVSRLHPAVSVCMADSAKVSIRSNLIFSELAIGGWNGWVREALGFRSSRPPLARRGGSETTQGLHDIYVVVLQDVVDTSEEEVPREVLARVRWVGGCRVVLGVINFSVGLAVVAGMGVSAWVDDYWSVALFAAYTCHWMACFVVGRCEVMTFKMPAVTDEKDEKWYYAAYEREEGGIVVYKGRKLVFEKLARSRWLFNNRTVNHVVHWSWMITGSTAAAASVVCMVNMGTALQLAFLGILLYSTVTEILATRIVRTVQNRVRIAQKGGKDTHLFGENEKRAQGMIKAKMAKDENFRLENLNWVEDLHLLPKPFEDLDSLMNALLGILKTDMQEAEMEAEKKRLFGEFQTKFCINSDPLKKYLLDCVQTEWAQLLEARRMSLKSSSGSQTV